MSKGVASILVTSIMTGKSTYAGAGDSISCSCIHGVAAVDAENEDEESPHCDTPLGPTTKMLSVC